MPAICVQPDTFAAMGRSYHMDRAYKNSRATHIGQIAFAFALPAEWPLAS